MKKIHCWEKNKGQVSVVTLKEKQIQEIKTLEEARDRDLSVR